MKKLLAVSFALAAMALVVTGCAKKAASGGGDGKPAKITVEVFDRGTDGGKTDPTNNQWTKWIKEKVLQDENIEVEFVAVHRWTETEGIINLMAAGTAPDVAYTYAIDNVIDWGIKGGVYDVGPYIDTTLKDLKAFLGPDDALPGRDFIRRNQDSSTGKVYALPQRRANVARLNVFIRKDWLDILGLPLPTTKEEFFNDLVAFRDQNPGKVRSVIPFDITTDVRWNGGAIMESFIDPTLSTKDVWTNIVAERYLLIPGYKEGVRFLNRMYNENLIDKDFPLYEQEDTWKNLIKSGVVGSFSGTWDRIFRGEDAFIDDLLKNVPTAEWAAVDCFESSDGITHKNSYDAIGLNYFIPASAKNPDAAMRYLNWLGRYENYHFIQVGLEGVSHTIVDGIPKLNPTAGDGWIQNSAQNTDYSYPMQGLFLGSQELNVRAIASQFAFPTEMVAKAYNVAMNNAKPFPVVSTAKPLVALGPVNQTLVDKSKVILVSSISAAANRFDSVYDSGLADWLNSGGKAVRDERIANYVEP
jgi:putative aldouronate transport system substrate-binding protein